MTTETPLVHGISEADFNSWKHNPVTKVFREYLLHYAAELERGHLIRWKSGKTEQGLEDEAAGRILTLEEMSALEFESMYEFYQETEQQEENETTDLRDPAGEV